jgi:hypothetical protein
LPPVIIEWWKYPAPFRTRQSSTTSAMILPLTGDGKVAHCRGFLLLYLLLFI